MKLKIFTIAVLALIIGILWGILYQMTIDHENLRDICLKVFDVTNYGPLNEKCRLLYQG